MHSALFDFFNVHFKRRYFRNWYLIIAKKRFNICRDIILKLQIWLNMIEQTAKLFAPFFNLLQEADNSKKTESCYGANLNEPYIDMPDVQYPPCNF